MPVLLPRLPQSAGSHGRGKESWTAGDFLVSGSYRKVFNTHIRASLLTCILVISAHLSFSHLSVTFKPFLLDPTLPCDKPVSKK